MEIGRDVHDVCSSVTGSANYVPCVLCTGYVHRPCLEPGLLPEETHHDAETLDGFFQGKREWRLTAAGFDRKQVQATMHNTSVRQVLKKPAAALARGEREPVACSAITKKPASSRQRLVRKKPAAFVPPVLKKPAQQQQNSKNFRMQC